MARARLNIPYEIDVLESPSDPIPGPFSSFSGIPGSALAERIFNDPDSWEDTDTDEGDYPEDVEEDALVWLSEEIEKIKLTSAGHGGFQLPPQKRDSKGLALHGVSVEGEDNLDWRGIAHRGGVRPISLAGLFESTDDDFSGDIQHQLSKILKSGGIKHHLGPRPLSATLSSPLTGCSSSTSASFPSASSIASSALGNSSPAPLQSASATLSFLEYYGIFPDSPLADTKKNLSLLHRKSTRRKPTLRGSTPSSAASPSIPAVPTRISIVSPPGLNQESRPRTPPGLKRPSSASPTETRDDTTPTRSNSDEEVIEILEPSPPRPNTSPRSRPLPTAAPPPYPRSPSPSSRALPAITTPIRRLPTIPPETASSPSPSPPRLATRHTTYQRVSPPTVISPPAKTSTAQAFLPLSAAFSFDNPTPFTPYTPSSFGLQTPQISSARPQSTIRSPLGPVGPRTRARTPSGDSGRPTSNGHRPPVLRL